MNAEIASYQDVLDFWFDEKNKSHWFSKDPNFDAEIAKRFLKTHHRAAQSACFEWRKTAKGRLAEIIVLDQFPRNMFRNSAKAFASDPLALALAQDAVERGIDKELATTERSFLYMPYMHSEALRVHDEAIKLFSQPGLEHNLEYEVLHKKVIERFGRYPHRNKALGRESTPDEVAYLAADSSSKKW
ncbi:MAG: DUF924 family protein [Bdellovibrionota bacterium]